MLSCEYGKTLPELKKPQLRELWLFCARFLLIRNEHGNSNSILERMLFVFLNNNQRKKWCLGEKLVKCD